MSGGEKPRDRDKDFEQASSKLNQGLKACRSMLNDYRAVIGGEQGQGDDGEPEGGDDKKSG